MKKKLLCVFVFITTIVFTTGCVKMHTSMNIKKDKSMDFSIIYGINNSYIKDESVLDDEEKKKLEQSGFTISEYSEDSMKGIRAEKKFKNIDEISVNADAEYNLGELLSRNNSETYMFQIKKGFLKNTYIAKFNFNLNSLDTSSDDKQFDNFFDTNNASDMIEDLEDESLSDNEKELNSEDIKKKENVSNQENDDMSDIEDMVFSTMDLKFNVTLPYSAKRNNASISSNNDKELTWNLANKSLETIEFEFELYNMKNVYIFAIIGTILLIFIIVSLTMCTKKKYNKKKKEKKLKEEVKIEENKSLDSVVMPIPQVNQMPSEQTSRVIMPQIPIPGVSEDTSDNQNNQ